MQWGCICVPWGSSILPLELHFELDVLNVKLRNYWDFPNYPSRCRTLLPWKVSPRSESIWIVWVLFNSTRRSTQRKQEGERKQATPNQYNQNSTTRTQRQLVISLCSTTNRWSLLQTSYSLKTFLNSLITLLVHSLRIEEQTH